MVMVMVGELDRIGDHGPSSAVDEEEEDVDLATTMHQFSLTLSEVQHWLVHSCTIFLCRLYDEIYISDDPYRYQNMNNKDHRVTN